MPDVTGTVTEVGGGHLDGAFPEIHFKLNAANRKGGVLVPTQPFIVSPASNGVWTANLQQTTNMHDLAWYTLSIRWLDLGGNYVRADFPDWALQVPASGGAFSDLISKPPTNTQMVWVSLTPPPNKQLFTKWLEQDPDDLNNPLNTGILYEWSNA
ncbi:hypothetical protein ARZXY2_2519 [Arthrobacter sp. ZXY-2]|nr:hypothetical protein ARZXY2_2519 [Arthrobacter sp. ZXY-2]